MATAGKWAARLRTLGWKKWLAVGVAALVIVGGTGTWLLTRGTGSSAAAEPITVTVTSGTIKQTVSVSGTLEPQSTADLDFAVSGTVTKVYVAAGDKVKKGEALAQVDDTSLVAERTAAYASLEAARAQYTTDYDADASSVQLASDKTSILSAEQTYADAVTAVKDAVLRSTIAGTVTTVDLAKGDVVGSSSGGSSSGSSASSSSTSTTSTSAFEVVSTASYEVSGTVAAADAATLKKGQEATITLTGVTTPVYGVVSSVGAVATTGTSGEAVFPVVIKVTGSPSGLYSGVSATASVVVKQVSNVLSIISRAIQTDTSGTTYVDKIVDGKVVKTTVKIGTVYGPTTQIVSGLASGDTVQVPGVTASTRTGGTTGGTTGGSTGGFGGGTEGTPPAGFTGGAGGGFGGGQ